MTDLGTDEGLIGGPAAEDLIGGGQSSKTSFMDKIRAKRVAQEDVTLDLPIPGYDNELVGRYRVVTLDETEKIGKRVRSVKDRAERMLLASLDGIALACEGLYWRDNEGELHPMGPNGTSEAWTFSSPGLSAELGFDAENARDTILGIFGRNEFAIVQHNVEIARWMSGGKTQDDFLGE